MSAVRDWLLGVTAAALAVALAQALAPEGAVKKVSRLVGGMVLLLAVAKPLFSLEPGTLAVAASAWSQEGERAAAQAGEEVLKTLIAEKTSAYIVDKGDALGITCRVETAVQVDGNGWAVPWSVTVQGDWTESQRQALSELIARELNIPSQRQSFQKEGV